MRKVEIEITILNILKRDTGRPFHDEKYILSFSRHWSWGIYDSYVP